MKESPKNKYRDERIIELENNEWLNDKHLDHFLTLKISKSDKKLFVQNQLKIR